MAQSNEVNTVTLSKGSYDSMRRPGWYAPK